MQQSPRRTDDEGVPAHTPALFHGTKRPKLLYKYDPLDRRIPQAGFLISKATPFTLIFRHRLPFTFLLRALRTFAFNSHLRSTPNFIMRCNTLLVFVFAAVSAPSLAAPLGSSDNSFVARSSVEARKLAARINGNAMGSLMIAPFYSGPSNPTLFGLPPTPTPTTTNSVPTQTSTTTDNAPTPIPTVANRVPIFGPPVPIVMDKIPIFQPTVQGRELHELLLRAMADEESGAGIWGDLWNIGSHVLTSIIGNSQPQQQQPQQPQQDPQQQQVQQRRDLDAMYELLARAIDEDESGAGFWSNALQFGTKILAPLFLGNNQPQPQPLPAPPAPVQPSPQLQPSAQQVQDPTQQPQPQQTQQQTQQQRRDVDIMYSLLARAANSDDESGASIWSTLAGFAASLFGGGNNQRRDVDMVYSLLARAAAASDDESGANFWSDFTNIAGTVASAIFGRDGESQMQRRDVVYELLKRAAEDEESGAGIIDFLSQIFL